MVHFVYHISRATEFQLKFMPIFERRNFQLLTFWPEFEPESRPYGPIAVMHYGVDDNGVDEDD